MTENNTEQNDSPKIEQPVPEQSINDTMAANLLNKKRFSRTASSPEEAVDKTTEEVGVSEKPEPIENKSGLIELIAKPAAQKETKDPVYSEEVQKEIDNYKKQVNDIKSNFHKTHMQNKLLLKRIDDLYDKGDIDDDVKKDLSSNVEPVVTKEEQSIYEWDDLMDKASEDLNKRFEYTKDENIDKYSDAFMHYMYSAPKDKGVEIMDYLKKLSKTESVERAVSEMLELGEHFYKDGMEDFFDNDRDIKKTVSVYKDKLKSSNSEIEKLKKENEIMKSELNKYKEINVSPSSDYKSSGAYANDLGRQGMSALMIAKQKLGRK